MDVLLGLHYSFTLPAYASRMADDPADKLRQQAEAHEKQAEKEREAAEAAEEAKKADKPETPWYV